MQIDCHETDVDTWNIFLGLGERQVLTYILLYKQRNNHEKRPFPRVKV